MYVYRTYEAGNDWDAAQAKGLFTKIQLGKQGKALSQGQRIMAVMYNGADKTYNLYAISEASDKPSVSKGHTLMLQQGRERERCSRCYCERHLSQLSASGALPLLRLHGFTMSERDLFCIQCFPSVQRDIATCHMIEASRPLSVQWARDMMARDDVVILDTETTGLGRTAGIVELSVIALDGSVLFNSLLNPGHPIPVRASKVHGIYDDDVSEARLFADVFDEVVTILSGKHVVVYNLNYDCPLLEHVGLDSSIATWDCAMVQYAAYYGQWSPGRASFRWQCLTDAVSSCVHHRSLHVDQLGFAFHRALGDCYATKFVIESMAMEG